MSAQTMENNSVTVTKPVKKNPNREWQYWEFPKSIGKYTLMGYSRAADRTFLYIPELKIGLDAGGPRGRTPPNVFITHTHFDHVVDVWYLAQEEGVTLFCPKGAAPLLRSFIKNAIEMNAFVPIAYKEEYGLIEMEHNDEVQYDKARNIFVKAVRCYHKIPSVGYAFFEKRRKLKEEYRQLSKNELIALKKSGVDLSADVTHPLFVFLGDTSVNVFTSSDSQWLFEYPVIITECTFLDEGTVEKAELDGHVHWSLLQPIVLSHPSTIFVLTHFSLRYSVDYIHSFFLSLSSRPDNPLPLHNVVLFLCDHSSGHL